MTKEEIAKIYELKGKGYGYKKIANVLNAPLSTVKSIIIRHRNSNETCCLNCGARIVNKPKTKRRKFCSEGCKRKYIASHPECIGKEKSIVETCQNCGKEFTVYASRDRKFCSHGCYIAYRYKKGGGQDG